MLTVPGEHGAAAPPGANSAVPVRTRDGFFNAALPYRFVFPRDHAAHFGYQSEWWYYTGHVRARDGCTYGYELTFFRFGLRPGAPRPKPGESEWRGNQVYPAHFAVTDECAKRFAHASRFAREALGAGFASARELQVRADDWTLRDERGRFVLRAGDGRYAIAFELSEEKRPAVHGRDGVSRKAACATCASHYYSLTRLRTHGTLSIDGRRFDVGGISWMDHEFGSDELQADQSGWDWFSLQLDDRRELMVYRLRERGGSVTPESSGSIVEADGSVTYLAEKDVAVDVSGSWKSPHTGAVYPSGWRVRVPSAAVDVVLTPVLADQELADAAGGVSYWEGAVDARDAATHRPAGAGYVELTGYAKALSL